MRKRNLVAVAVVSTAVLLSACSLAGYAQREGENEEELPTLTFTDYSHTVVLRGKPNFELKAAKAEVYETSKKTILSDVSFSEFDPDTGELLSFGKADSGIYHTDTKDAEFSGSVRLESKKQDAILEGEYLKWIDKDRKLEGRLDRTVTISRSDGSMMSGAGFEADARKRSFSFRENAEGRVESEADAK